MVQEVRDTLEALPDLGRDAIDVTAGQMALRAIVVYVSTLVVVRLGNKHLLSKATTFDVILGIMLGSVLRGIPAGGSVGRTALDVSAGARLYLSGVAEPLAAQRRRAGPPDLEAAVRLVPATEVLGDSTRQALESASAWIGGRGRSP